MFKQFAKSTTRDPQQVTLPTSLYDNIMIVDLCDVPTAEKVIMKNHIDNGFLDAYTDWVNQEGNIGILNINYIN